RPGFSSHHLHGGSQPSATRVPGDPMSSSDLHGCQTCIWYTDIHADIFLILKPSDNDITCVLVASESRFVTAVGVFIEDLQRRKFHDHELAGYSGEEAGPALNEKERANPTPVCSAVCFLSVDTVSPGISRSWYQNGLHLFQLRVGTNPLPQ
ncbi:hypothetical protein STEG23_014195, partial [Scotinomys teguina]